MTHLIVAERRPVPREMSDSILEALIELARVVNRAERDAAEGTPAPDDAPEAPE